MHLPPDVAAYARIEVLEEQRPLSDEEFFEFCQNNSEFHIERDANGEITIMPPAGAETGDRSSELNFQLRGWAKRDGRGKAFDASTGFVLPDKAMLSPDASWVLRSRIAGLSQGQKQRFLPLCPDFVVELISPSDRLSKLMTKMTGWMANGAQLGWLIDPARRTVYVYRPGKQPEQLTDVERVSGEGPVEGFVLELQEIWQGL